MKKRAIGLTSLVVLLAILAACGASTEPAASPPREPLVVEQAVAAEHDQANAGSSVAPPQDDQTNRMIIWTADIVLTVKDTEQAISDVLALAREMDGHWENSY